MKKMLLLILLVLFLSCSQELIKETTWEGNFDDGLSLTGWGDIKDWNFNSDGTTSLYFIYSEKCLMAEGWFVKGDFKGSYTISEQGEVEANLSYVQRKDKDNTTYYIYSYSLNMKGKMSFTENKGSGKYTLSVEIRYIENGIEVSNSYFTFDSGAYKINKR